jgi:hypothetical protein
MKIKSIAIAVTAALALALSACSGGSPAPTPTNSVTALAADFASYSASMDALLAESNGITDAYDAVTGANYTNDQTMYNGLTAVDPKVGELLTKLQAIHPATPELQALHSKYIDAWITYQKSIEQTVAALEQQSKSGIAEANASMSTAKKLLGEYKAGIVAIKKQITG